MHITVFTDGGARGNPGPAAIGGVVYGADQQPVFEFSQYIGKATNNEAEYAAVKTALQWIVAQSASQGISQVLFKLDSLLVVQQLNKSWKIKEPRMLALAQSCWQLVQSLAQPIVFTHIPRTENKRADELVNQALDAQVANAS